MALWKIAVKVNSNGGQGKILTKGMFIELSTVSAGSPFTAPKEKENIIRAFNNKYSTRFDPANSFDKAKMSLSYLTCERIG